ncbi:uncharacterized protein [Miscanthus floridulus]|uniref:uncharacterized protein n=1 Tax=Miscanthus floridulus TaxID=154761 RepID=UPI00345B3AD5
MVAALGAVALAHLPSAATAHRTAPTGGGGVRGGPRAATTPGDGVRDGPYRWQRHEWRPPAVDPGRPRPPVVDPGRGAPPLAAARGCPPAQPAPCGAGLPRSSSGTTEGRGGGASPPPARRRRRRRAAWYSSCNIVTCLPKRLFIIVNPYGGKGSGQSIFQNEVLPLTETAGVLYTMQGCQWSPAKGGLGNSNKSTPWDHSGRQTLHALQCATSTGNGMARSLLHAAGEPFSISNAGFAIIRSHKRALDVTSVMQGNWERQGSLVS